MSVLIAMLAVVPCLLSQTLPPQVRALDSRLDLGIASPEAGHAARATMSVVVVSAQPWNLSGTLLPGRSGSAGNFDPSLKIRDNTGNWVDLPQGIPASLANGPATPAAGQAMTFAVEVEPSWDDLPGVHETEIRFALSDGTASDHVRVVFQIDPATVILTDAPAYSLNVPDPSHPGLVPFEKATYRVTSNVPWRLIARLGDVPRIVGSNMSLANDALVVKIDGTKWTPVPVADGVTVTRGTSTGGSGVPVQLEFAIRTNASEIGGKYSAPLEVAAIPIAAPQPN